MISGAGLCWQHVGGVGSTTTTTILKQGFPQGSVLSPLLLLFYIDHLHWHSGDIHIGLFADNLVILAQNSKLNVAEMRLHRHLDTETTMSKD